ncbi:MAG: TMEM43 family protein [Lentisphaeraceae bacterium]|nr:TMEM43 family protein [Lentisphaeraceae bacterium]
MSDSFTEVTSENWGSRIMSSIKGILFGGLLFLVAFPVLWFNEGRAVNTAKRINFAKDNIVVADAAKVESGNEGKLVHLAAKASTEEVLKDEVFGVSSKALKLTRKVEVFQWVEEKESKSEKKLGGSKETVTTYKYSQQWSDTLVNSSEFKKTSYTDENGTEKTRQNPTSLKFQNKEVIAKDVSLGAYKLPEGFVRQISKSETLMGLEVPKGIKETISKTPSGFYIGKDLSKPQVGDLKISYSFVPAQDVSILAKQVKDTFSAYNTPFGNFERLEAGVVDASGMIANAKASNSSLTWILRVVGFVLMLIGLSMIFAPLAVIADVVPFIGSFVSMGTFVLSGLIAIPFTALTIGIAWIFYRPMVGVPLVLIALGAIYVAFSKRKKSPELVAQTA